jgi:hypothetical protein
MYWIHFGQDRGQSPALLLEKNSSSEYIDVRLLGCDANCNNKLVLTLQRNTVSICHGKR